MIIGCQAVRGKETLTLYKGQVGLEANQLRDESKVGRLLGRMKAGTEREESQSLILRL